MFERFTAPRANYLLARLAFSGRVSGDILSEMTFWQEQGMEQKRTAAADTVVKSGN